MWQLVINGPGYFDTRYDLAEGETQVGRADENEIVLSGDLVSRRHGKFHLSREVLQWEDLGSRNGSKVNGSVVIGTLELKAGDVVQVGENKISVARPTVAESASTELVSTDGAGGVKRFGKGVDVHEALLAARDIGDSGFLKALDEMAPFEAEGQKAAPRPERDTDEVEPPAPKGAKKPSPSVIQSLVLMYKVAERLVSSPSQQAFLDEVTDLVMERVNATTGVVLLRHATGVMVPSAVRHSGKLGKGEVPVSDAIVDAALMQGQAIAVASAKDDVRFKERESVVLYAADQVLCIPIGTKPPFSGVLYLNRSSRQGEPLEALLDTCTAITQLLQAGLSKHHGSSKNDEQVRRVWDRVFPPDAVEQLVLEQKGAPLAAGLEEKQGTVLVVRVTGLPAVEKKVAPAKLTELMNAFHKTAKQLVFSFGGAVMRLSGDGVVAFFPATGPKSDAGIKAVRSAVALRTEWEIAQARLKNQDRLGLKAALHTGKALTGLLGQAPALDYAVVGEVVELTHALCDTAQADQVLISAKTLAVVGARFDVSPLGERALGAAALRLAVFEVLDEDSDSGTLSGVRGLQR